MYNTNQYIKKAKKAHHNLYDYSLVNYKKSIDKITIICKKHGKFEQIAAKHLNGSGCPICGGSNKKSNKQYIFEAKIIHKNKYDYSATNYKTAKGKITIICKKHGKFEQSAYSHLKGSGCPNCYLESKNKTTDQFIIDAKNIHFNTYDYSKVKYVNNVTNIIIICNQHGQFNQIPSSHLSGSGCPKCSIENKKLSKYDFIQKSNKIHNNIYDYSKSVYLNNYTKTKIICKKHGLFYQTPNFHMLGQGCPKCKRSLMEEKISIILDNINIIYESQKTFKECKNKNKLPFDFYLPNYNICIECHGKQHYEQIKYFGGIKTLKYIQNNDNIKKIFCENNNITYFVISYLDNNIEKIIKKMINI